MSKESLLILFCFCNKFQQGFESARARLSTMQIYNAQSSLKTEDYLGIEAKYNIDQPVVKSYFQPKLKLQYQSINV